MHLRPHAFADHSIGTLVNLIDGAKKSLDIMTPSISSLKSTDDPATYNILQLATSRFDKGSLCDRGANGGQGGNDIRVVINRFVLHNANPCVIPTEIPLIRPVTCKSVIPVGKI